MSKELEKLALIQKVFEKLADWNAYDLAKLDKDYETNFDLDFLEIEKALKALEIIKNKRVNFYWLSLSSRVADYNVDVKEYFYRSNFEEFLLTEEEYELLKEALL